MRVDLCHFNSVSQNYVTADTDKAIATISTTASLHPPHPNNIIPPELLSERFSYLPSLSEGTLLLRHIPRVSRSWYQTAICTSRLWMTIVINRILCERYLRHAPCLEVVFKACFYRTAPCTFELHLDTVKLLPGSSPSDQTAYQVAMSRIVTVRNVVDF
jgi:hypothetical protein